MQISSIAPYLIAYLLGVATPILIAALFFQGQNRDNDNCCFLVGVLGIIILAIVGISFLWAKGII
jgi:hypothetical protein